MLRKEKKQNKQTQPAEIHTTTSPFADSHHLRPHATNLDVALRREAIQAGFFLARRSRGSIASGYHDWKSFNRGNGKAIGADYY